MNVKRWVALAVTVSTLFFISACTRSNDIKIGVIIPQEGSNLSDYGYQITSGIQMAMSDLKAKGQLTKNYELIIRNEDQQNPDSVITAYNELVAEGVSAVIGPASSASMLALVDTANDKGVVVLSPAASSPEINPGDINSNDHIFRVQPADTLEAQTLANTIFQKTRIQKVLMVRAKHAYAEGITFELLKLGRQNRNQIPPEVVKFDPDPAKVDHVAVVDRIIEWAPEAVFLGGYTDDVIPLIREIRGRDALAGTYIFTSSSFLYEKAITQLGQEMVEGIIFTAYEWEPAESDPVIQDFAQRFENEYKVKPDIYAANGYDATVIMAYAIDTADHWMPGAIRDQLGREEYTRGSTNDIILRNFDFNKRGDVTMIPNVYRIVDGVKTKLTAEDMEAIKTEILTRI